ncbi:MAG TPA: DUF3189 family protein [Desulfobacteria bacterium]|nr:DUF3189 family protein [Desulfobacteria bacterium]
MKIIYNCYGGSHSSVTSAAIHLGLVGDRVPCARDLCRLPNYDAQVRKDHGTLRLMGTDEFQNQVYVVGRRSMGKPVSRAMAGLAEIFGIPKQDFMLVDPMPFVNLAMMIGGYTSRRLGLIPLGRPIVCWGTRLAFPRLRKLVAGVKKKLQQQQPLGAATPGNTAVQVKNKRIVVYCDYTGRQQAAAAASMHLGRDIIGRIGRNPKAGNLNFCGTDVHDVEVYTLGVIYENELIPKVMREFAKLYGIPADNLTIVDLIPLGKTVFAIGALFERVALLRHVGEKWTKLMVRNKIGGLKSAVALINRKMSSW